jgi:hypothetical protein
MPQRHVKAWWDTLTPEQRGAEALNLLGSPDPFRSWDLEWDLLSPSSQQAKLLAYFNGILSNEAGEPLRPVHTPPNFSNP